MASIAFEWGVILLTILASVVFLTGAGFTLPHIILVAVLAAIFLIYMLE